MLKLTAVLAVVFLLVLPAVTSATIHSGSISFVEPTNPPSIGEPKPPPDQSKPYLREVLISYDDSAGSITLEDELWSPNTWGENLGREGFTVAPGCGAETERLTGEVSVSPKRFEKTYPEPLQYESGGILPPPIGERQVPGSGVVGSVELKQYNGSVTSTGSFNGQRFAITFTDPAFRHRKWSCAQLAGGGSFPLGGWPPRQTALVCVTPPLGLYVGRIKPRQCLIDRPGARRGLGPPSIANAETLNLFDLRWTSWTTSRATATGYDRGERPGMIGSKPYRVRVIAFRRGTDPTTGGPMFTRVTEYSSRMPRGHTVIPY